MTASDVITIVSTIVTVIGIIVAFRKGKSTPPSVTPLAPAPAGTTPPVMVVININNVETMKVASGN